MIPTRSKRLAEDAGWYRVRGKRLLDVVASITGLIALSPLLAAIAAAIRLEDRGPAIFRQSRVGAGGGEFTLVKFRSMPVETPNIESAEAKTLRVTRVGKLIRRTSLDELPQLVNVVVGDMSLVGPRPALPTQYELIDLRRSNGSFLLRPGLTGLAQLEGYDGMPNEVKADWDARYARAVSLKNDLRLIARTFLYLVKPPPTY